MEKNSPPTSVVQHFDACLPMISVIAREKESELSTHVIVIEPNPVVRYVLTLVHDGNLVSSDVIDTVAQLRKKYPHGCLIVILNSAVESKFYIRFWKKDPSTIN